ncbi:glycosyltransferase family 1 protein [Zopfia rhizophila CBS 207.26]|uniref:Glycosyltransferase family 1 protein n=1 Tax=Zopfia rhizophila CBS 207.26 TaxID=1314779 RepID=A0A6A6ETQ8_9PEZI|nr:glycosyltransferase family 1 protein [Zopfia rhizophila CBS 207.26]
MTASNRSNNGEVESSSHLNVETMSNADLYCITPPAYAMSAGDNEVSIEVQDVQDEKAGPPQTPPPTRDANTQDPISTSADEPITPTPRHPDLPPPALPIFIHVDEPNAPASRYPDHPPPIYISAAAINAAAIHVKRCSILPNRPAAWLVKRKNLALSALVAAVLTKEGIIRQKDLELIPPSAGIKRDPADPMSAVLFATYDTVSDVLLGLVEGPVEAYRQFTPVSKHEGKPEEGPAATVNPEVQEYSGREESAPLRKRRVSERSTASTLEAPHDGQPKPSSYMVIDASSSPASTIHTVKQVAIGTGKGFGRIVGAGLKSPMTFTHALTRGFHNTPKLYGDEVREYENVTDLKSGMRVSAKGFGYGIYDGVSDLLMHPIQGARKQGVEGFVKGMGKGIGGIICKPTAGACGIVGYTSVGVYKEIQSIKNKGKNSLAETIRLQGESEWNQSTEQMRLEVVSRWCHVTMQQHRS